MDIKPYSKNAKKHPDKQLKQIAESIKEFGWQQPIVVDKNNEIIIGHGRWFAYQKYGKKMELSEPEIKRANNLTKQQVKAYRLADNKLNESDWDMDLAIEELKELDEKHFDLTGFDKDLLIEPEEKDDEVPEVPKKPKAKYGDIYQLRNHRIMCGNATKQKDVEKLMDGKRADMVFTDPPYGIDYKDIQGKFSTLKNDKKEKAFNIILKALNFLEKPIYICCNWQSYIDIVKAMEENNFLIKSCIIWDKGSRIQNLDKFAKRHEFILYSGKFGGERTLDDDIWLVERQTHEDHPTAKPVELIAKAIKYSSKRNQIVLDVFGGSGSTLIAAEKLNRKCFMMEIDPKYCDVIIKRYEDYTGNKVKKIREQSGKSRQRTPPS